MEPANVVGLCCRLSITTRLARVAKMANAPSLPCELFYGIVKISSFMSTSTKLCYLWSKWDETPYVQWNSLRSIFQIIFVCYNINSTIPLVIAKTTTLENSLTVHYCGLIQTLFNKSVNVVRDLDPTNDLTFLRIRSKKNEIMVAPREFFLPMMTYLLTVIK